MLTLNRLNTVNMPHSGQLINRNHGYFWICYSDQKSTAVSFALVQSFSKLAANGNHLGSFEKYCRLGPDSSGPGVIDLGWRSGH